MAKETKVIPPELQTSLDELQVAANGVATEVQSLKDIISTSMTQGDVNLAKNTIDSVVAKLKGLVPPAPEPTPA